MKRIVAVVGLAMLVASCNTGYDKTKSGLAYKIINGKGGAKLKAGQFVKVLATVKIAPRDTVLFSTAQMPEYVPVDTSSRLSYDFNEVLRFCSVGDSLVTVAQVDTLVKKGNADYKGFFKRGDQIVTSLRILGVFDSQEAFMKDRQQEFEAVAKREAAELEKKVAKLGVKGEKTENGVIVVTTTPGTGEKLAQGKLISVNYNGYLLETGKKFDSNTDTSFQHAVPYQLMLGTGQTIRGWEEALMKMSVGTKATIYIPSALAYGPMGSPPAIPGYASLKFDLEVLKQEEAPTKKAGPAAPIDLQKAAAEAEAAKKSADNHTH